MESSPAPPSYASIVRAHPPAERAIGEDVLTRDEHSSRVNAVVKQVQARPKGVKLTIGKKTKSHTPHSKTFKLECHPVDVENLCNILAIQHDEMRVIVEGQVKMEQLVEACIKQGVLPQVCPEISDFTVAGLINGLGIETSSHKYGGFVDIVAGFEVVLGDGRVLYCDENHNEDLFYNLPGSYGTLGIVTGVVLKLMPAKPFVRTEYRHFNSVPEYCAAMEAAMERPTFVEGFVFSMKSCVLMLSEFVATKEEAIEEGRAEGRPVEFHDPFEDGNRWIHQHALRMCDLGRKAGKPAWDVMGTKEYIFRSERGWLWTLEAFAGMPELTKFRWVRKALDRKAKEEYASMDNTLGFSGGSKNKDWTVDDLERCFVQQDTIWLMSRLEHGINYVAENLGVWPLWHCPCKMMHAKGVFTGCLRNTVQEKPPLYLVDMGIYGEPMQKSFRYRSTMRKLQMETDIPTMFGQVYLTHEELCEFYDLKKYAELRRKYNAEEAFKTVEEKVSFYDETKEDLPKIPFWRLKRAGLWTPLKYAAWAVSGITAATAGALLWKSAPSSVKESTRDFFKRLVGK